MTTTESQFGEIAFNKGDRHIDVFWCLWSLWFNLKTDKYTDYFLDLYGREKVNLAVIKKLAQLEEKI